MIKFHAVTSIHQETLEIVKFVLYKWLKALKRKLRDALAHSMYGAHSLCESANFCLPPQIIVYLFTILSHIHKTHVTNITERSTFLNITFRLASTLSEDGKR